MNILNDGRSLSRARRIDAIVFDLDGTLIDSLPDVIGAMNRLLAQEGRREIALEEGRMMIGEGAVALIERAWAATGGPPAPEKFDTLIERYLALYRASPANDTYVYPGVVDVLGQFLANGVKMGVCTNKPDEISKMVLSALGLDRFFASIIGGDVLPVRKPDPGHIHAVLEEMGCDAATAVYIGDSPTDMEAARNARLPAIAVTYGYSRVAPEQLGADILVDSFSELPDALRRF